MNFLAYISVSSNNDNVNMINVICTENLRQSIVSEHIANTYIVTPVLSVHRGQCFSIFFT